jgi:thiol-disulfide isomerase/thioredoxin
VVLVKHAVLTLLLTVIVAGCGPRRPAPAPPAPEPMVAAGTGEPVELAFETLAGEGGAYAGRILLLDFSATWSAPCRAALPGLNTMHAEFDAAGFSVVGMVMDQGSSDELRRSLRDLDVDYEMGRPGPGLAEACGGVRALPTRVLLDRDRRVFRRYEGAVDLDDIRGDLKLLL